MKQSILCVDDELGNVDALERLFRLKYNVLKATSGLEALEILKKNKVSVIISDQRMPKMTGTEFLKKTSELYPESIRILLTGYADIESIIEAINSGEIYRYISKPWDSTDLTNTVAHAAEKYHLNKELKTKNKALNKALEEIQNLDQAKNNFMYLINHELKTPLTVISSYLQILKESDLQSEQINYINKIEQSTNKLSLLILDVLEIISAETGQKKIKLSPISTEKLLKNIELPFIERTKIKNLNFLIKIEKNTLNVDKEVIRSLINRLLENSIKFANKDSQIDILITNKKNKSLFKIINKGPQLDEDKIEKILKPFVLDEDFMNHSTGFGLGLNVCQSLLHAHKSELKIKSIKDKFIVSFEL